MTLEGKTLFDEVGVTWSVYRLLAALLGLSAGEIGRRHDEGLVA